MEADPLVARPPLAEQAHVLAIERAARGLVARVSKAVDQGYEIPWLGIVSLVDDLAVALDHERRPLENLIRAARGE